MTRKLTAQEKTRRRIERRLGAVLRAVPMSACIPDSERIKRANDDSSFCDGLRKTIRIGLAEAETRKREAAGAASIASTLPPRPWFQIGEWESPETAK